MDRGPEIRRATSADAAAVAEIQIASFRATYDFPGAHSEDEVRGWVADVLIPTTETWVADEDGQAVAFISLSAGSVEQLYVLPAWTGRGIGSRLIALAKERRPRGLTLYTFQVNEGARRFYERHGFRAIRYGDGTDNEERQPDVQYAWRYHPPMELDPVVTNPELYRVVMENERVRVLEYRDRPGDRTTPHRHPDSVMHTLSSFRRRLVSGGSTREVEIAAGTTSWLAAQEHAGENIGETETHVIFVELKEPPGDTTQPSAATVLGPAEG